MRKAALSLLIGLNCLCASAGEWRLSGEARMNGGEWLPLQSQSDTNNTLIASEPQRLLPGDYFSPEETRPAMVGGVVRGDGWRYQFAIQDPSLGLPLLRFQFRVRDSGDPGEARLLPSPISQYNIQSEVDLAEQAYWATQSFYSLFAAGRIDVRYRLEYRVLAPELSAEPDQYSSSLWEGFDLHLLPRPQIGKLYVQTSQDALEWQTYSVQPTWFERDDVGGYFGPVWCPWSSWPERTQSPQRFFRAYQVSCVPTEETNIVQDITVSGVAAELEVLKFGDDCEQAIARAHWTIEPGSGSVEIGLSHGGTSITTVRERAGTNIEYRMVQGIRAEPGEWVIFARLPQ